MTKKPVYVIGDCHTSRVQEHYDSSISPINFVFWGKASKKIWSLDFQKMKKENDLSSGKEIQINGDGITGFSEIKDDGVVFSWLGYVDIRTFLTKYDNSELIIKRYMSQLKKYFKNSKVYIIEPLPQFTEMLLKYDGISPYFTHEERLEQNKKFLKYLHRYAKKNNYEILITQQDILDCLGVRELTPGMTHNLAPHPVDGLQTKYSKKIYELFEFNAKKILGLDNTELK